MATIHTMPDEKKIHGETLTTVRGAADQLRAQLEDSQKEWLDIKTAARHLSLTHWTIREYIAKGILEGKQIVPRGKWRVTRASVEKALVNGRAMWQSGCAMSAASACTSRTTTTARNVDTGIAAAVRGRS